jgi:hypothetical protein
VKNSGRAFIHDPGKLIIVEGVIHIARRSDYMMIYILYTPYCPDILRYEYRPTPREKELADEETELELRIFPGPLVRIRKPFRKVFLLGTRR